MRIGSSMGRAAGLGSAVAGVLCLLVAGCATRVTYPPAPPSAATPDYRYVIGPGDAINVMVWRNPELSLSATVKPDGRITLPLVEDLYVMGMDSTTLAREMEKQLSKYIQNPIVTIMIGGFVGPTSEQVRVLGAATRPTAIPYRQHMTLIDLMIAVGGITEFADGNAAKILRTREGNQQYSVRLKDLMKDADLSANVELKPGDVLIIPESWF